jgi:uncharacterized Zn finger protein
MQEYRRTCRNCGTIWHSLVEREKAIESASTAYRLGALGGIMQSCGTCGMCGEQSKTQNVRNLDAHQSELFRLRSCPNCGSINYYQELLTYGE